MLSDTQIRQAKGTGKAYRLYDARNLYLEVTPPGGKCWRFKYHFNGKEKRISLGRYPDVSLSQARERREEARSGIDPSVQRQAQKAAVELQNSNSFELVAREWFLRYSPNWAPSYSKTVLRRLEKDIFPWLGSFVLGLIKDHCATHF
jgi:Arm DNA-binding domain